jgi:chromosome segregation ATPase
MPRQSALDQQFAQGMGMAQRAFYEQQDASREIIELNEKYNRQQEELLTSQSRIAELEGVIKGKDNEISQLTKRCEEQATSESERKHLQGLADAHSHTMLNALNAQIAELEGVIKGKDGAISHLTKCGRRLPGEPSSSGGLRGVFIEAVASDEDPE